MNDKLTNALIEALTSDSNEIKTISSNSDKKVQNLAQLAYDGYMWDDADISDDNHYEKLIIDMSDIMDTDLSEEDNEKAHQILLDLFEQNGWEVYTEGGAYPWNGQIITVNPYTAIAIRENKIEESIKVTEGNLYNYEYIIYRQRATKAPLYVKDYSTETENISEAVAFPTQEEAEEYKEELELEHKEQYKIGIKNDRKDENKELTESKDNSVFEIDYANDDLLNTEHTKKDIVNSVKNWLGNLASQVKIKVVSEKGPAGGAPVVQLIGNKEQIGNFLVNNYNAGEETIEDIYNLHLIKENKNVLECDNIKKVEAVEYISKAEYDKLPADYKTTIAQTLKARQATGDNVEELRKLYKDLGYEETDPMILASDTRGTILKPVKIQESDSTKTLSIEDADKKCIYATEILKRALPEYNLSVQEVAMQIRVIDRNNNSDFKYTKRNGWGKAQAKVEEVLSQIFGTKVTLEAEDTNSSWGRYCAIAKGIEVSMDKIQESENELKHQELNNNIKDFYTNTYTEDTVGKKIKDNVTFLQLYRALKNSEDIYTILGVDDSTVRERVFKELAKILNIDYDYVYNIWQYGTVDGQPNIIKEDKSADTSFDIDYVIPNYTGGGVYEYKGKLKNGNYFIAGDDNFGKDGKTFYPINVWILDIDPDWVDPDDENYDIWLSEYLDPHTIRIPNKAEAQKMTKLILGWIINNAPEGNYDMEDIERRLDITSMNENKTEKYEITETIINKLNEAYGSTKNVSDNKEDGFTYAKILVDFFDDIDYEKWNEEQDTSKREDMVRPNMKAFVDRYGKELINRPNTIQGMFDYLEDWNYHTQYGVLKQELDKFMQDNDTKLTESSKLEDYWDATIVAKDGFMTLLKFNFGSDLHHNNYMITVDANDVKRFYASDDKEAISIYEQFKTEWQNSDHVSADLNVQPLVTENNSNATLNQENVESDKTTLTDSENGLKVPNKLNEANTQRYTVYIIEEPNEECSPYTIYDNDCDDFYFDENGFNPVFDTESETEQYIKENLTK